MPKETPSSAPIEAEVPKKSPETPNSVPNDYPPKKGLFEGISHALRNLSQQFSQSGLGKMLGLQEDNKKTNKLQEFFANIMGFFNGISIEKGVTIGPDTDINKVKNAFRPIIDLDETAIELKVGDFLVYNKELGTVDLHPADKNQKTGYSLTPHGKIPIANRTSPIPTAPTDSEIAKYTKLEKGGTALSYALGDWLTKRGPAKEAGKNMCGRAVHYLLKGFGIDFPSSNGNDYYRRLKKDKRFKQIEINSLNDIPPGAIMTYSGKGTINGKPHGTEANQKAGHVEIKASDGMFYSFYAGNDPGGSAKAPRFHNNFAKWKEATGFTGAFVPVSKV